MQPVTTIGLYIAKSVFQIHGVDAAGNVSRNSTGRRIDPACLHFPPRNNGYVGLQVVRYQRNKVTMLAPDTLKGVHPLGKSPVVEVDGRILAETGLIVEYFVERYGVNLAPPRQDDLYWRQRYWLHYAEGSAMPQLLLKLFIDKLGVLALPVRRIVKDQLMLHLDYLEAELNPGPWFLGERFSAADIMLSFPIETARARAGLNETRPKLMSFLQRIHARPAYQRALKRGDPYSYAA